MYDSKKAKIEEVRDRFEKQLSEGSPKIRATGSEYLDVLSDFVDTFNNGPGADPRLLRIDTTGELKRMEEQAAWADDERRRVRRILGDFA